MVYLLRDVILGILTIIGKSTKEKDLIANEREGVSEAGAGWGAIAWQPRLNSFPFPPGCLEFIQLIAAKIGIACHPLNNSQVDVLNVYIEAGKEHDNSRHMEG